MPAAPAPPVHQGQKVVTPEGPGQVTAFAQLPGEWRIRVKLDNGDRWVGSAALIRDPDEVPSRRA
jgi:hypothetical protein